MNKRKVINLVVLALCIIITAATLVNVFGDNEEVIKMAERTVCWEVENCKYAKIALVRTPIGQTITFQGDGKTVEVTCRRSMIVFGGYACEAGK